MKKHVRQACRRMAAAGLGLLLIVGALPPVVMAEDASGQAEWSSPLASYRDVPDQAYYWEELELLTAMGIVEPNAEGGFAPDLPVTRADLAVWLARALGLRPVQGTAFTDVPASSAEAPYIQALHQAGLVRGYGDGTFRGGQPITRAEAASLLAGITGQTDAKRYAEVFADVHTDDWFAGAVGALANMRVISGKADGIFAPADLLTRGEAAALLHRLLFKERRIEALEGETVTINGQAYRYADALASLFWEANRNALVGSVIQFVNDGDTIVAVTGLEIRGGDADSQEPVFFDGGGGVIDGSLYVSADYAVITDVHVKQNLIVTPSSRKAILLHGSVVEKHTVLAPVAGNPNDRPFIFLYADVAFVEGVVLARDADVVNLAAESALAGAARGALKPFALRGAAKSDRPVAIASIGPFFNADWYLGNNPDLYEAITSLVDHAKSILESLGRHEGRAPSPLFDPSQYLTANPDAVATFSNPTNAYEHFMQYGASEGHAPMNFYGLQAYISQNPDIAEAFFAGLISIGSPDNPPDPSMFLPPPNSTVIPPPPVPDLSKEQDSQMPQRFSLHFVGSSVVNIGGNTELDIVVPDSDSSKIIINGDAGKLAIRVDSPESGQSAIVIEINGQVDEIILSGEFDGEIVFAGSGKIGAIETEGDESGAPSIRFEGELEVGTVNGEPAARPNPATSPSDDSGSDSDSDSPPVYQPSVTAAVYAAYAHHANFEIETADAVKVYYAAMYPESDKPDAQALKDGAASSEGEAGGMKGEANVSAGRAAFTVTQLAEMEQFMLYVAAEAPDGTLSEVYMQPFTTEAVKIVNVNYARQPLGEMTISVKLNTLYPASVYWLLTDEPDDDLTPLEIKEIVTNGCDPLSSTYCEKNANAPGTDTAFIFLESVDAGLYYLYATAERKQLSPVFRMEVQAD